MAAETLPLLRQGGHRRVLALSDPLYVQLEPQPSVTDALHTPIDVFKQLKPKAEIQLAGQGLDSGKGHPAQCAEPLVVVDALLQVHLPDGPQTELPQHVDVQAELHPVT